jgi:serine/threonine-protein kinase
MDSWAPPLGAGALGIVHLGYNYYTRVPVAVKQIKPEYSDIPFVRDRARSEAQLTFLHPNIVRMLGICEYQDNHGPIFVLSEFVNGLNFDVYCREVLSGMEPDARMCTVLQHSVAILDALDYVHKAGVVHRDVKPSNIMVSYEHVPKLMDLGIAGFVRSGPVRESGFMGTALYAAPELISGDPLDARTDIYAMGVTIFELLTGYNPFYADNQEEILARHLSEDLPADFAVPHRLLAVLRKATERKKKRRHPSAASFAEDIKGFLDKYVPNTIDFPAGRLSGNKNRW